LVWVGGEGGSSEARKRSGQKEMFDALWHKQKSDVKGSIDIGLTEDDHRFETI
jgi:hypothetical protein